MAKEKFDYQKWLQENFEDLIDNVSLTDLQKKIIKRRWLDQLIFFERASTRAKRNYSLFRITAIIGGILVPLIASLNLPDVGGWRPGVVLTSIIGSVVAAVSGLEGFLRYGDQTRQYRQSAEMMKIEAWSFFSLTGEYGDFATHADGYEKFAGRVEDIIRLDVRSVMSKAAKKEEEKKPGEESGETEERAG